MGSNLPADQETAHAVSLRALDTEELKLQEALDALQQSLEFLEQSQADVAAQFQWLSDRVKNTEDWAKKTTTTMDYILDRVRHLHPHPPSVECKCGNMVVLEVGEVGAECPQCGEMVG